MELGYKWEERTGEMMENNSNKSSKEDWFNY